MKRTFLDLVILAFLISACSSAPSAQVIQTAIARTQIASYTDTPAVTDTPEPTLTPTIDIQKQILINNMISLLNQGTLQNYQDVEIMFSQVDIPKYLREDPEIQALFYFAGDMDFTLTQNQTHFDNISPDYDGVYSAEIKQAVLQHISMNDWEKSYRDYLQSQAQSNPSYYLSMGMTEDQVIAICGEPKNINQTITSGTTFDQWVYSDSVYLYFENGMSLTVLICTRHSRLNVYQA